MLWVSLCWKGIKSLQIHFPPWQPTPLPSFPESTPGDITNKRLHVEKHSWKQKGHITPESWGTLISCLENSWQLKVGVSLSSTVGLKRAGEGKGRGERERESFENKREEIISVASYRNKCSGGPPTSNPDLSEWVNACMIGGKKKECHREKKRIRNGLPLLRVQRCAWAFLE